MRKKINFWMWDIQNKLDLDSHHGALNIWTYLLGLLFIFFMAQLPLEMWLAQGGIKLNVLDYKDTFYTQLSTSFIVISLTTILSSNAKQIYWTDKIELTLVKPIFSSFSAYATYIFASLTLSAYWCLKESPKAYISLGCSVLIMTSLTFQLIEVYFGSGKVKRTLEWYFEWLKTGVVQEYEETKQKMVTVMSKNMIEHDFNEFFENFDFLYLQEEYESLCRVIEICANYNIVLLEQVLLEIWDEKKGRSVYEKLLDQPELRRVLSAMESQMTAHYGIANCISNIEGRMTVRMGVK